MWAQAYIRALISYPVGREVQAAVCKTAETGATPVRDSISSGIGVDRHTLVFQTEIEGALPSCPSSLRHANAGVGQDFHPDSESGRRFNSAFAWRFGFLEGQPAKRAGPRC